MDRAIPRPATRTATERTRTGRTAETTATEAVARPASPLGLGLRLRLMLTLTAVAIFPIAFVSDADLPGLDPQRHRKPSTSRLVTPPRARRRGSPRLHDRRQLHAVAVAASPRLQGGDPPPDPRRALRGSPRRHRLLDRGPRPQLRPAARARPLPARAQRVNGGPAIGSVVAQLPADAGTAPATVGGCPGGNAAPRYIRLGYPPKPGHAPDPAAGATGRIRAVSPRGDRARTGRTLPYLRVVEAGLLALLAMMLLTLVLARPCCARSAVTEEQASEARIDALTGLANRRALE